MPTGRAERIVAALGCLALLVILAAVGFMLATREPAPSLSFAPASATIDTLPPVDPVGMAIDTPIRRGPAWFGDFETGDFTQWDGIHAATAKRVSLVRSPVRHGKLAARFELQANDVVADGQRSEVYEVTRERAGVESWWAWSVYFPAEYVTAPGSWTVFTQWHDHPAGKYEPPVLFEVRSDGGEEYLKLSVRGGHPSRPSVRMWKLGTLQREHWYDFVFHVRWGPSEAGLVALWINGDNVVRDTQTPTTYVGKENYLKQGNYRYPYDRPSVLYQDAARRAYSAEELRLPPVRG